ncbi:MAG: DEAD/DEAH box helicase [Trueperaceae bacterium]
MSTNLRDTALAAADIKARLPHVWRAFFAVHGNFTDAQKQAMPILLDGRDVLLVSATATGKTEAAVAPLLERHLLSGVRGQATVDPGLERYHLSGGRGQAAVASVLDGHLTNPADRTNLGLTLLYLCPTRALVRDLFERLRGPLSELGIAASMKSGDTGPVSTARPPAVLVTTPESLDSLLTRAPRLLTTLRALVLDEIHLFDDGPRGDQLRCLLRRIERIRDFHHEAAGVRPPTLQRVALSATVPDPLLVAERYLRDPAIIQVPGGRRLKAELYPLESLHDLAAALAERSAAKTLVFCNTRNEVEQVASYLRHHLGYEAAIFVHYSNLDPLLRNAVETQFAEAGVAVCVSSSTLELGIDIGSIDEVALMGPPSTPSSFLQRIGRGGRRGTTTRVLCLARSAREYLRFQALLEMSQWSTINAGEEMGQASESVAEALAVSEASRASRAREYHFRPSVLVQQVFSLLKQSPTGGLRFADLRRVAPDEVTDETVRRILNHLAALGYLRCWRPGEWRPGELLAELADAHEIHGNIGGETLGATIVDAYSGRKIARADRPRSKGETLLMGGRPVEVAWQDRYTYGVNQGKRPSEEALRFRTAPQAVPLELAQEVAAQMRLAPGQLQLLADGQHLWLFHFWGDVYGHLLVALLRKHLAEDSDAYDTPDDSIRPQPRTWNELCLLLPFPLDALPPWDSHLAYTEGRALLPRLQRYLGLGRFQPLLPPDVATRSALDQIDLPRLEALYRAATVVTAPAGLREELRALLS